MIIIGKNKLNKRYEENMFNKIKGKLTKRILYGSIVGGLIGLIGIAGVSKYNKWRNEYVYNESTHVVAPRNFDLLYDSEANKELFNFPVNIPGASKVEKYITPNAKYCLVHVRQIHTGENLSDASLKKVENVQDDIYKILIYLCDNNKLKDVYCEAVSSLKDEELFSLRAKYFKLEDKIDNMHGNNGDWIKERISELENILKRGKDDIGFCIRVTREYPNDKNGDEKYMTKLKKELEEYKRKLPEAIKFDQEIRNSRQELFKYHTIERISYERGIRIISAEKTELNIEAIESFKKANKDGMRITEFNKKVLDNREDALLEIVASIKEKPMAFVVYGGAHEWGGSKSFGESYFLARNEIINFTKDNIYAWNNTHKDKKFSLIEITPKSYK